MISDDGITLENQLLIEDDAPACGYSSKEGSVEVLKKGIVIKKILQIEKLPVEPAKIAMLVYPDFPPQPNNGRHLLFNVNGHDIAYELKHFWTDVPVPVSLSNRGITLSLYVYLNLIPVLKPLLHLMKIIASAQVTGWFIPIAAPAVWMMG